MKKKLLTRFPASRIKKIMQADEDVGKIAMAVPLLVSKALELFLKDLCDRTYGITLQRGAKTMNSFHLKQCIHTFNVFDFLAEIVSKVPDLGGSDAAGEDRSVAKRRKADDEEHDSDEEIKRSKTYEMGHNGSSGRGRGRGIGRGRGRNSRAVERENAQFAKSEDDVDTSPQHDKLNIVVGRLDDETESRDCRVSMTVGCTSDTVVWNFDLNVELSESGDTSATPLAGSFSVPLPPDLKHEEYPGWSISDMDQMAIDPLQFAQLNRRLDENNEDYDGEE